MTMSNLTRAASAPLPATVFDLDGTLADSVDLIEETLHMAITNAGHTVARQEVRSMIGRPLDVALAELTEQEVGHDSITAIGQAYRSAYLPAIEAAGASLLLPGVPAMLERLRAAGHAVGVVTAKQTAGAEHLLEVIGIRHLVDVLVGTDRVSHGKPAPDSALLALTELGAEAGQTWYVGDAISDMTMAIAAGMKPMGVTSGVANREELFAAGARSVVDTPNEMGSMALNGA